MDQTGETKKGLFFAVLLILVLIIAGIFIYHKKKPAGISKVPPTPQEVTITATSKPSTKPLAGFPPSLIFTPNTNLQSQNEEVQSSAGTASNVILTRFNVAESVSAIGSYYTKFLNSNGYHIFRSEHTGTHGYSIFASKKNYSLTINISALGAKNSHLNITYGILK